MLNTEPDLNTEVSSQPQVHVAVAVVERVNVERMRGERLKGERVKNDALQILISRRHAHVHQGGLWEFPGGKVEAEESIEAALVRELQEELGITALKYQPLLLIEHDYGDKLVKLDVWRVTDFSGEVIAKEGQLWRWVDVDELTEYTFPDANQAILKAIQEQF